MLVFFCPKKNAVLKKGMISIYFRNRNHAAEFIHKLQEIYSSVRLFEIKNDNDEKTERNERDAGPIFDDIYGKVKLTVHEEEGMLVLTTSVPAVVGSKLYCIEMDQYVEQRKDDFALGNTGGPVELYQLRDLLVVDSLTALYNRRFIDKQLPMDLTHSYELDKPLTVIFGDIDYFKRVNDRYGHVTGDQVLRSVADLMREVMKGNSGWVARYGGEEFLICLPQINRTRAMKIAIKMRKAIESYAFYADGQVFHITCSFGVHTIYKCNGIMTVSEIVAMADKKLYRAKQYGRNMVIG